MRRNRLVSLPAIAFLFLVGLIFQACTGSSPIKELNPSSLKRLIEKGGLTVVDTRTEFEYRQAFIPGAVHLPEEQFFRIAEVLPADHDAPVVFYCRGYG